MDIDALAAAAGIGRATLYQLRDPRLSTLQAICGALDVTVGRLTKDIDPK